MRLILFEIFLSAVLTLYGDAEVEATVDCSGFGRSKISLDAIYNNSVVYKIGVFSMNTDFFDVLNSYKDCINLAPAIFFLGNACDRYQANLNLSTIKSLDVVIIDDTLCEMQLPCFIDNRDWVFLGIKRIIHMGGHCVGNRRLDPLWQAPTHVVSFQKISLQLGNNIRIDNSLPVYAPSSLQEAVFAAVCTGRVGVSSPKSPHADNPFVPLLVTSELAALVFSSVHYLTRGEAPSLSTEALLLDVSRGLHQTAFLNTLSAYLAAPLTPVPPDPYTRPMTPTLRLDPREGALLSAGEVGELVGELLDSSPRACPLPLMRHTQAEAQVKWMHSHMLSLRSQGYDIVFLCADGTANSFSKLAIAAEGKDGHSRGQGKTLWAWDLATAGALGHSTRHGDVKVTPYQLRGHVDRTGESKCMVRFGVVVVGEHLEERRIVDTIRLEVISSVNAGGDMALSNCSISVVGLLWSESTLSHPVDSHRADAVQSFVNILLLEHPLLMVQDASTEPLRRSDISSVFRIRNTARPSIALPRAPPRARTILLTHMFNEEFLLPHWIAHHAPLFDMAVLVDYNSTDSSLQIIRELAPSTWRVVQSRHPQFLCKEADLELMAIERMYPDDWKIVLTVAEFLLVDDLRSYVVSHFENMSVPAVIRFPSYLMVDGGGDGASRSPLRPDVPLVCQRSQYFINHTQPRHWFGVTMYSRFIHRGLPSNIVYGSGRHYLMYDGSVLTDEVARELAAAGVLQWRIASDGAFIAKYKWAPWPESLSRTLQIFPKISEIDRQVGTPHTFRTAEELENERRRILSSSYISDFSTLGLGEDLYADLRRHHHSFWSEFCRSPPRLHFRISCQIPSEAHRRSPSIGRETLGSVSNLTEEPDVCLERVASDTFGLDVVYYRGEAKVSEQLTLRFKDVLQMHSSSLHAANAERACKKFCIDVLYHADVILCISMLMSFAYNWVFDMNMAS